MDKEAGQDDGSRKLRRRQGAKGPLAQRASLSIPLSAQESVRDMIIGELTRTCHLRSTRSVLDLVRRMSPCWSPEPMGHPVSHRCSSRL